jgi:hypothetical protein
MSNDSKKRKAKKLHCDEKMYYLLQMEYKSFEETLGKKPSWTSFRNHLLSSQWQGYKDDELPSARSIMRHLSSTDKENNNNQNKKPRNTNHQESFVAACGHKCHPVLKAHLDKHFPDGGDNNVCHTCMSYEMAKSLQEAKNQALENVLRTGNKTRDVYWPDGGNTLLLDNGVETQTMVIISGGDSSKYTKIPNPLQKCQKFIKFTQQEERFRVIKIDPPNNNKYLELISTTEKQVLGAMYPSQFEYRTQQLLERPIDANGVVISGTDIMIIGNLGISCEAEVDYVRRAMPLMRLSVTGVRPGDAAGKFIPLPVEAGIEFDTTHHAPATKEDRAYVFGPRGGMKMIYLNHQNGDIIDTSWGTGRNPTMLRRNKHGKRSDIKSSWSVREKTIAEMESRIVSMVFISQHKLCDNEKLWHSLQVAIDYVCRGNRKGLTEWKSIVSGISLWHAVLLEWASGTGEMHNYEPLRAHRDSNKAHPLESYTLHGKVDPCNPLPCSHQVLNMTPGLLVFPFLQFGFKIHCSRDVCHLMLGNTVHVPDLTRGKDNFSAVHGP